MNNEQEHIPHLTTEQLLDYLEQRLSSAETSSVEEHLATDCAACVSEMSWLDETLKMMSSQVWVDPPRRMSLAAKQLYRVHRSQSKESFSISAWWRSLFDQPRPLAVGFAAALALIIVGALVFQFWFNQFDSQEAEVAAVQGNAVAQSSDSDEWQPITKDTALSEGDQIRTGDDSSLVMTYPNDSMTMVGSNTELAVLQLKSDPDGSNQQVVLRQNLGLTHNVVQPLTSPKARFEIQTPAATITVRGTEFTVEVDAEGVTQVAVSKGIVGVAAEGTAIELTAGEGTTVIPGSPPATIVPVPTLSNPADFATPLSSRIKSAGDSIIGTSGNKATATATLSKATTTTTPDETSGIVTPTPSKTPKATDPAAEATSTSSATPSKTRESPPTATPSKSPTIPAPTESPTTEPPTTEPPTTEPPTTEPPTTEPPTTEPPTTEPPTTEPPTTEPPTLPPPTEPPTTVPPTQPPPTEPPPPPSPTPPDSSSYPPPSSDPPPTEPPPPPPTEPPSYP